MKPAILFVSTAANWPLTDGKRQRTWFLLETLTKNYWVDMHFIGTLNEKKLIEQHSHFIRSIYFTELDDTAFLQPNILSLLSSKEKRKKKKLFNSHISELYIKLNPELNYSFIFSRYIYPLFILSDNPKTRIVCDIDDVYFEVKWTAILREKKTLRKFKLLVLYLITLNKVKSIIRNIDLAFIVKESDRSFYGLGKALCLPNLPFAYYLKNDHSDKTTLRNQKETSFGFLGKLSYKPNYEGIIHFIESIWNTIIQDSKNVRLVIAGAGEIPDKLLKVISSSKQIDLLGYVNNPEEFWEQINALVVPVQIGGGTNIKIAEAFMHGKLVIADPFASRGYDEFIKENYLMISTNCKEWVSAIEQVKHNNSITTTLIRNKAKEIFNLENWQSVLINSLKNYNK